MRKRAKPTIRTVLALDLDVREALEKYANERELTLTEAIHEIIRKYLPLKDETKKE